jgi:hypothetical protein
MNDEAYRAFGHGSRAIPIWLARGLLVGLVIGAPLVVAPAAHASCPLTQPSCVLHEPPAPDNGSGLGGVLDGVGGTAGSVVDGATDAVGGAVDDVGDAVGGVVDDVGGTVGGVVIPPGSGDVPLVDPPSTRPDPISEPSRPIPNRADPSRVDPPAPKGGQSPLSPVASPSAPGVSLVDRPAGEPITPRRSHQHGGSLARVMTEAARQLAFPLALLLVVASFLVVQDRLDRRDPKLALAPMRPEVARFD